MPYGSPLHADHESWPSRNGHTRAHATADPVLAATLARLGVTSDYVSDEALAAVKTFAHRANANGLAPAHVATVVRRSLAAAAPAAMTVVSFEVIARCLVRHALHALIDD